MLFSVFRRKSLFDEKIKGWIFDCFSWALESFGSDIFYEDTHLVKPTEKFFPDLKITSDKDVESLFIKVKEYSGMGHWKCTLRKQKHEQNSGFSIHSSSADFEQAPSGTFKVSKDTGDIIITYNPSLQDSPVALIATFAHELSHYLCLAAEKTPPGGNEFWEPATDLLSVFTGFGLFSINSSYKFNWFNDFLGSGWKIRTQGYLSQYTLSYILGIFCILKSIDVEEVTPFLKSPMKSFYKKSLRELSGDQERIDELRKVVSIMKS